MCVVHSQLLTPRVVGFPTTVHKCTHPECVCVSVCCLCACAYSSGRYVRPSRCSPPRHSTTSSVGQARVPFTTLSSIRAAPPALTLRLQSAFTVLLKGGRRHSLHARLAHVVVTTAAIILHSAVVVWCGASAQTLCPTACFGVFAGLWQLPSFAASCSRVTCCLPARPRERPTDPPPVHR